MKRVALQLHNGVLHPFSPQDAEAIKEYKENQVLKAELYGIKKERSYQQLKLFWACCKQVSENTDDENWDNPEKVAELVKIALGYYDAMIIDIEGKSKMHFKTKSISYEHLPHIEACRLFDRAWIVMAKKIGTSVDELLQNAERTVWDY